MPLCAQKDSCIPGKKKKTIYSMLHLISENDSRHIFHTKQCHTTPLCFEVSPLPCIKGSGFVFKCYNENSVPSDTVN